MSFTPFMAAALVFLAVGTPAHAQTMQRTTPPPTPTPPAAPAPDSKAPGSSPARNWVLHCAAQRQAEPRDCRLSATAIRQPQNQRILLATLMRQPETRSLALVFQMPHGAALQSGTGWQVDDGEVQRLPFHGSDAEGLYAGVPVTDELLAILRRGTTLRVSFVLAASREGVTVALPLAQFAEATAEMFAGERQRAP